MRSREETAHSVREDVLICGARKLRDDPGGVEGMHALAHTGTSAALYYRVLGLVGRHRAVCGDGCPSDLEALL